MLENKNHMDEFGSRLQKELQEEAERIEEDVKRYEETEKPKYVRDSDLTPKQRKELHARIYAEVEANNKEKVYAQLSNEDMEALELGKKILAEKKVVRRKKKIRGYVGLAATIALILGISVNSFGGPEKVIFEMKKMIGKREVVKTNSAKKIKETKENLEEVAYQQIKDELGIDVVRIIVRPDEMEFEEVNIDAPMQTAELSYMYGGERIIYYINASHNESSWGLDVADEVTDQWEESIRGCKIEVKGYNVSNSKEKKYSAKFEYNKVSYFINGIIVKEDFEKIVKNLYFI